MKNRTSFYPALATAFDIDQESDDFHSFRFLGSNSKTPLVTVKVDERLDRETAERFMWLFYSAPHLWQALRELASALDDREFLPSVTDAIRNLWDAGADMNPFGDLYESVKRETLQQEQQWFDSSRSAVVR